MLTGQEDENAFILAHLHICLYIKYDHSQVDPYKFDKSQNFYLLTQICKNR